MVSLKTIKKRLKSGSKSTGCNTITPVNSDQNGIRGTENPACDIWASESFDSVEKIDSTTHRQLSLPEVKSTSHNEIDIQGNFLQELSQVGPNWTKLCGSNISEGALGSSKLESHLD